MNDGPHIALVGQLLGDPARVAMLQALMFGLDVAVPSGRTRPLCRACMDWSERRHHLAGVLGARLLALCLARRWATRTGESRVLSFNPRGERALFDVFDGAGGRCR